MADSAADWDRSQPRLANRWPLEQRMFVAALLALLPSTLAVLALLWLGDYSEPVRWTLSAAIIVSGVCALMYLRDQMAYSLRTIANLLSAIREGDYSIRLRPSRAGDALDELIDEANALRDMLHAQRVESAESAALVERVLASIDVAVFAFDSQLRLRRANAQAQRALGIAADAPLGRSAAELGVAELLIGNSARVTALPGDPNGRRWELRRTTIRQYGEPLQLVILWDVTAALRSEQQEAWSRLVRVMRHEINNSLAPVSSLAATLLDLVERRIDDESTRADFREALGVISDRSKTVERMLRAYGELSAEPPPVKSELSIAELVRGAVAAERRTEVALIPGPEVSLMADRDQLDRALVNLVRNAVDANLAGGGRTTIGWSVHENGTAPMLEIWVEDEGPGLLNQDNLFVPFFTTKPGGSGVGLALARQIAEAHGGSLTLANKPGATGCKCTLRLPLH